MFTCTAAGVRLQTGRQDVGQAVWISLQGLCDLCRAARSCPKATRTVAKKGPTGFLQAVVVVEFSVGQIATFHGQTEAAAGEVVGGSEIVGKLFGHHLLAVFRTKIFGIKRETVLIEIVVGKAEFATTPVDVGPNQHHVGSGIQIGQIGQACAIGEIGLPRTGIECLHVVAGVEV